MGDVAQHPDLPSGLRTHFLSCWEYGQQTACSPCQNLTWLCGAASPKAMPSFRGRHHLGVVGGRAQGLASLCAHPASSAGHLQCGVPPGAGWGLGCDYKLSPTLSSAWAGYFPSFLRVSIPIILLIYTPCALISISESVYQGIHPRQRL